jgi:hypothetical protein
MQWVSRRILKIPAHGFNRGIAKMILSIHFLIRPTVETDGLELKPWAGVETVGWS